MRRAAYDGGMTLAIIGDIGGTSMKLALLDASGTIRARHDGPGANLRSAITPAEFAAALGAGIDALLAGEDAGAVELVYLAVTGAGGAGRAKVQAAAEAGIARSVLARGAGGAGSDGAAAGTVPLMLTDDIAAAFLANEAGHTTGVLALAGTGAIQAAICDSQLVRRTDGLGWVLGDVGSGTWLGQQVLRAVAADLDGTGEATELTARLLAMLNIPADTQALIASIDALPPASWGRFARIWSDVLAAGSGADGVAARILHQASDRIARGIALCARELRERGVAGPLPLVWAGGVATRCAPLRAAVIERVERGGSDGVGGGSDGFELIEVAASEPLYGVAGLAAAELRRRD